MRAFIGVLAVVLALKHRHRRDAAMAPDGPNPSHRTRHRHRRARVHGFPTRRTPTPFSDSRQLRNHIRSQLRRNDRTPNRRRHHRIRLRAFTPYRRSHPRTHGHRQRNLEQRHPEPNPYPHAVQFPHKGHQHLHHRNGPHPHRLGSRRSHSPLHNQRNRPNHFRLHHHPHHRLHRIAGVSAGVVKPIISAKVGICERRVFKFVDLHGETGFIRAPIRNRFRSRPITRYVDRDERLFATMKSRIS